MNISPLQIRAARGALKLSQRQLAKMLNINFSTMSYYEGGLEMPPERMRKTIALFEDAGIKFLNSDHGQGIILSH